PSTPPRSCRMLACSSSFSHLYYSLSVTLDQLFRQLSQPIAFSFFQVALLPFAEHRYQRYECRSLSRTSPLCIRRFCPCHGQRSEFFGIHQSPQSRHRPLDCGLQVAQSIPPPLPTNQPQPQRARNSSNVEHNAFPAPISDRKTHR